MPGMYADVQEHRNREVPKAARAVPDYVDAVCEEILTSDLKTGIKRSGDPFAFQKKVRVTDIRRQWGAFGLPFFRRRRDMSEKEKYPGLWSITNHFAYLMDVIAKDFSITTQKASLLVRDAVMSTPEFNRIKRVVEKKLKEESCTQS